MSAASSEGRHRPKPIRTAGPDLNARSLRTRMAFKSPAWTQTASPLSPFSRPMPLHPDYGDERMKEHDKATVGRLEPRSRNSPNLEPSLRKVPSKPISQLALPTAVTGPDMRPALSAPLLAPPPFRRPTIAEETRNMLIFEPGLGNARDGAKGKDATSFIQERRMSAPPGAILARHMALQRHREQVRRRLLMGSHEAREADLFVIPVEHRGMSTVHATNEAGLLTPFPKDERITIRVVVHSQGRKPMALTRNFDIDELRATIPDPSHSPRVEASRRASLAALQTPLTRSRPPSPAILSARRHSSAGIHSASMSSSPPLERRGSRQIEMSQAVPMHLEYARAYLPALAAIILSEIVRHGDTIELPLPHPRAWKDTVAHIYTGRVALTEPVKENILYLGGKV